MSLFSTKTLPPAPLPLPATRPIASAAAETTWIEVAEPFQCTSEVGLSQALYQADGTRVLHMAQATAGIRLFTLEDVVLDSDALMLFQNGDLLAEDGHDVPSWAGEIALDPGTTAPQDDAADFILGCNPGHADYHTWLTQCLPAIDWALRLQAGRPARLVLPPLEPWQQAFLDLLGYGDVPRLTLTPHTCIRFARLHAAEFLTGAHAAVVSLSLRRTIEKLLLAIPPAPSTDTILYVPGTQHGGTAPANQAEIIQVFGANGIRIMDPALPPAERIALFRNAHVVIGPTSSALSDVVFCRPRSLLWEWMPRYRLDPTCNRLAQAATVDYLADVFPLSPSESAGDGTWQAGAELIRQRMGQIAARLARQAAASPSEAPAPGMAFSDPATPADAPGSQGEPPHPGAFVPEPAALDPAAPTHDTAAPERDAPAAAEETDGTPPTGAAHPTPDDLSMTPPAEALADTESDIAFPPPPAPAEADTPYSAMEYLARTAARASDPAAAPPSQVRRSLLARLFGR